MISYANRNSRVILKNFDFRNDLSCHDHLPASSTYYKTSASKAKILNLMKEKLAGGEIALDEQENVDEVNHKKVGSCFSKILQLLYYYLSRVLSTL